ncbi:hypothetical protein E8E14_011319 [Neopestalotiopsis sp. 37M]|nr:hypothetical protein E8E14_011319 [Neopestalotiopsis sp. 37M]
MTGNAPAAPVSENPLDQEKKKKNGKVESKKDSSDSDISSGSSSSSGSGSSGSSSSSGVPINSVRYAEFLDDRFARHNAARRAKKKEARGSKNTRKHRKRRSRSSSTASSLNLSGSEVEALEKLEENKTTSTALKKLWKNVKHLREKIQKLEDAISDIESDDSQTTSKIVKRKIKQKLEVSKDKEAGNESKEEGNIEKVTASIPAKDVPGPVSSKKDANINDPTEDKNDGADAVGDATPEKESENPSATSTAEEIEKASDGDDEDSGDEDMDDEAKGDKKTSTPKGFELKYQFFYQKDPHELNQFYVTRDGPFIRVRWNHINHGVSADNRQTRYADDVLKRANTKKTSPASQDDENTTSGSEAGSDDGDLKYNLGAQIRFLLDFMDEHFAKAFGKHKDARAGNLKTIGFEDLWMLYKPGDIIYCPMRTALATANPPPPSNISQPEQRRPGAATAPTTYRQGFGRDTPQAYRIISVAGGRRYAGPIGPPGRMANTFAPLKLICYFLDLGGYRFDVVTDTFTFRPYDTEIDITDLEAYPLAYASSADIHGEEGMREFLTTRGKSFVGVSEASHKLYNGSAWTDSQINKEEIDTPVIVDFALAYQNNPAWRPPFCVPYLDFYNTAARTPRAESLEMAFYPQSNRSVDYYWNCQGELVDKARNRITETIQGYPVVGTVASDPAVPGLIAAMEANGDILLLPGVVYAFALRDRKWVALDLTLLQDTQYEDGWKDLILPAGHKEMVRAVVENHAAGSRATGGMKKNSAEVDIVRGKGKGCIILLHGEPGVGKTSTAECVAAFTKRPLFPITCGDIGYEPDEVERNLQKHFTLAHKWGCVMLLDEADVFLAKRSRDDIKRNGLVSVFLRILEYYAGILFLTTNRVGSFDDAFRSRLHLTLYYPKLDRKQTLQIFEMNIRRVRDLNSKREEAGQRSIQVHDDKILKFAKKHFETLSWNGRQIRNAFQTAIALAEFDVRDDGEGERQAVMSKKQFKTIAHASIQFDSYLWHTHGGADQAAKAKREQVRWDYEVEGRPDRKPDLIDSSSESSSDSSSSSSDSSSDSSDSSSDAADSSDGGNEKRRRRKNKKKGKGKDKKSKKSESKTKKSRSKKDKHS